MKQSATVIADSIGPNGKRITTVEVDHARFIHPELLRHRLFSFSVASSRAIPYSKQRAQVADDPMLPVLWPKQHKGMQGTELLDADREDDAGVTVFDDWTGARDDALKRADYLSKQGLSKQLTNRLLEPWVSTKCVITATEWDNFFLLRHPSTTTAYDNGDKFHRFDDKVNLNFPAEYNIQDLAIKIKAAMDASIPQKLGEGAYHLPFIDISPDVEYVDRIMGLKAGSAEANAVLVDISAARCARTSYGKNLGKTIEDDLKLAEMLRESNHWSPFEHQAQAINKDLREGDWLGDEMTTGVPKGLQIRLDQDNKEGGFFVSYWSRNFKGFVQARSVLDEK